MHFHGLATESSMSRRGHNVMCSYSTGQEFDLDFQHLEPASKPEGPT